MTMSFQVRRADPMAESAEARTMWFGRGDDEDLTEAEAQKLAEAKATIERIRRIQRLRHDVRRTETDHQKALDALAEEAVELHSE